MASRRMWTRAGASLLALGLVAGACGDDGGDSDGAATTSAAGASTTTATPQKGGSITIGVYSETRGLDPATGSGNGTAGGTEMAALYDTLVGWNVATRKYEMRTAESLVSNADATEWTLKIKPNITFRDGTAYDAEAVRFNLERYLSAQNVTTSRAWLTYVLGDAKAVTVVDPLTVKFTLKVAYGGFPALLAHSPGQIVSPAKIKALGDPAAPDYKAKLDAFNLKPEGAGAGPFDVARQWHGTTLSLVPPV